MKKWNDKTKRAALVIVLLAVGVTLLFGIRHFLYTEKPEKPIAEAETEDFEEVKVIPETEEQVQEPEDKKLGSSDVIVSTETEEPKQETKTTDATQSIQKDPVKTENEKPSDPPTEAKKPETSETQPENKEIPAETKSQPAVSTDDSGTPKDGDIKDGKIYFEGFGWIDYNGGGTSGTQADDIYENGNTIGIMD